MPAALTASKAVGTVRKWNCLGCAEPREVTALSKLTMVRSASDSSGTIGPNACAGSAISFAVRSVKCTSPAKARVMSPPVGAGEADPTAGPEVDAAGPGAVARGAVPHAASAATARSAGTRPVTTSPGYGQPPE